MVVTVEVSGDQRDSVGVERAESLEVARGVCVEWVGEPRLVTWERLSWPVATAFFNALREPTVADFDDLFGAS